MRIELWWADLLATAAVWARSMSYDDPYLLWAGSGILLFLGLLWLSSRIMRKALGHVQFCGTWFNDVQFGELIRTIDEDCKSGHGLMRHDEMALLRRWRFGEDKVYGVKQSGYV